MNSRLIERAMKFATKPLYRFKILSLLGIYKRMDDETYLKKYYNLVFGEPLNLKDPKTYSEKLQWLKLYDHNPLYTKIVDKYEVKDYVKGIIGSKYVIPTIGCWDDASEIDFSKLPDRFVLKCTHDSGGVIICKNKDELNIQEACAKLNRLLKRDFYFYTREWPYKDVPRRIIAEPYLEDKKTGELRDYKFFCFDGKVRMLFVASDRQNHSTGVKFDFFDDSYNHLDIINGNPNSDVLPEKPSSFDEMVSIAQKLSDGLKHVRIDLYEVDGKPYFGEFTLYHYSGLVPYTPGDWDKRIGDWLTL